MKIIIFALVVGTYCSSSFSISWTAKVVYPDSTEKTYSVNWKGFPLPDPIPQRKCFITTEQKPGEGGRHVGAYRRGIICLILDGERRSLKHVVEFSSCNETAKIETNPNKPEKNYKVILTCSKMQ